MAITPIPSQKAECLPTYQSSIAHSPYPSNSFSNLLSYSMRNQAKTIFLALVWISIQMSRKIGFQHAQPSQMQHLNLKLGGPNWMYPKSSAPARPTAIFILFYSMRNRDFFPLFCILNTSNNLNLDPLCIFICQRNDIYICVCSHQIFSKTVFE